MAKPTKNRNSAIVANVNGLLVNTLFSIGAGGCRIVRVTVRAMAATAMAMSPMKRALLQPQSGPSTVASTSRLTDASSSTAETPSGSRAPFSARTSGSSPQPATRVATPIGTLIRKIQRQLSSTSRPPTGGPDDPATAATPAQMPTTGGGWRLGDDGESRPRGGGAG